jgi:hypothetical protein
LPFFTFFFLSGHAGYSKPNITSALSRRFNSLFAFQPLPAKKVSCLFHNTSLPPVLSSYSSYRLLVLSSCSSYRLVVLFVMSSCPWKFSRGFTASTRKVRILLSFNRSVLLLYYPLSTALAIPLLWKFSRGSAASTPGSKVRIVLPLLPPIAYSTAPFCPFCPVLSSVEILTRFMPLPRPIRK